MIVPEVTRKTVFIIVLQIEWGMMVSCVASDDCLPQENLELLELEWWKWSVEEHDLYMWNLLHLHPLALKSVRAVKSCIVRYISCDLTSPSLCCDYCAFYQHYLIWCCTKRHKVFVLRLKVFHNNHISHFEWYDCGSSLLVSTLFHCSLSFSSCWHRSASLK